jgi:hypothetical protein
VSVFSLVDNTIAGQASNEGAIEAISMSGLPLVYAAKKEFLSSSFPFLSYSIVKSAETVSYRHEIKRFKYNKYRDF